MMPHLSIRARLIFLSILLLAILTTSLVLLSRELARDSEALAEEAGQTEQADQTGQADQKDHAGQTGQAGQTS